MADERQKEVWILGATGRVGQAVAERLSRQSGLPLVLVGRNRSALNRLAERLESGVRVLHLDEFSAMVDAVRHERPQVVINLLGSYASTAPSLARACMPGGAYVDLANDLGALETLVGMHDEAAQSRATLISGAGFGVLATEAVVAHLCAGRSVPAHVRVDALGSSAAFDGVMGEAFAQTAADVIITGGRSYRDGRLVPIRLGSNVQHLTLPDGATVTSAAVPSGELFAARRTSGAPNVDFTSALAPTAPVMRAVLPTMTRMLRVPSIRRMMVTQMANSTTKAAPRPRPHSWGHAVVTWSDGAVLEGWLRTGDAMDFTADALTAVTMAIGKGGAPHGAFTPAAAFGVEIAVEAGGTLIDR